MLLADVIASWLLLADVFSHCGRYKSHIICLCKPTIVECFCCGRCYYHIIGWCICHSGWWNYHIVWADVLPNYTNWNSHVSDSITIGLICGRWNSHFLLWLADVVAMVADIMATGWNVLGRCCCLGGRCYSHRVIILILVLCCWPEPHPICEADGICLCFCSGMGCWPLWTLILLSA